LRLRTTSVRNFFIYIQLLVLDAKDSIIFYNTNYKYVTNYDNLDKTLSLQLELVLEPFFDSLEKTNRREG